MPLAQCGVEIDWICLAACCWNKATSCFGEPLCLLIYTYRYTLIWWTPAMTQTWLHLKYRDYQTTFQRETNIIDTNWAGSSYIICTLQKDCSVQISPKYMSEQWHIFGANLRYFGHLWFSWNTVNADHLSIFLISHPSWGCRSLRGQKAGCTLDRLPAHHCIIQGHRLTSTAMETTNNSTQYKPHAGNYDIFSKWADGFLLDYSNCSIINTSAVKQLCYTTHDFCGL